MEHSRKEYLELLFSSNDVNSVKKFYHSINSVEELISWMKERPSAEIRIYERDGDKSITFVIPTPNVNSKLVLDLLESINKFKAILVESSGQYFNFARSVNKGVKKALEYNPRWIIISNDDIVIRERTDRLADKLLSNNEEELDALLLTGNENWTLCEFSRFFDYFSFILEKTRILKKFNVRYFINLTGFLSSYLCKPIIRLRNVGFFGPFMIVSSRYAQERLNKYGYFLDPIYINYVEDLDLLIEILNRSKYQPISVTVSHLESKSLGTSEVRFWRTYVNYIYFNYKVSHNLLQIPKIDITISDRNPKNYLN